jgi:ectoine hydroxylase-related dioxygenase (phytanoyl-CoA dioxygenase family)
MTQEKAALDQPFTDSRELLGDGEALGRRIEEDGYLFIRGLLDEEPLLDLRRQALEVCERHGWLLDGDLMEGRGRKDAYEGHFEHTGVYRDVQKLQSFHALAHSPAILDLLQSFLGEEILPHPRNILRVTLPGSTKMTTPPHQDYPLIQGTTSFYTVWFPLGDCPLSLGGLGVARGSNHLGPLAIRPAEGTGGVSIVVDESRLEWHASDFRLGDALIFNGLTVHKALNNVTDDLLRLSCDYRYQPVSEPITWDSLEPHMGMMNWAEIYANWNDDTYKYYWQRHELRVKPVAPPFELADLGGEG